MPVAGQVAIIGSASTAFGVHHDRSYLDLLSEAAHGAIADSQMEIADVDAAWLGTAHPDLVALQGDSGAAFTQALNFAPKPVTRVAAHCATGMDAVRSAALAIAAGEYDFVVAVGAEKLRDVSPRDSLVARVANQTHPTLSKGRSGPGGFALLANNYLRDYDRTREDLAAVAVKNHAHAVHNPVAQYREPITVEQVLAATPIADPLGVLDCSPTTDGAAAVVLTSVERARGLGQPYAVIDAIALAVTDGYYLSMYDPSNDVVGFRATRQAARAAYEQAGISDPRAELDVIECHDCFSITEILNYEDLGLVARGEGWRLLAEGATTAGGEIPVNLSGGLLSCGHPIGATGVRMIKEIADQVTGRASGRQVPGARRGLAHTLGGPGVLSCVAIISAGT